MYSLMQNNPLFQDNATLFDINHIDEVSLQDMLPPEIKIARKRLESFTYTNETITELSTLLTSAELLLMHLEFTLEVLHSYSTEEIHALKRRFGPIAGDYQKVALRDDLSPASAKYSVYLIYIKLWPMLRKTLNEAFTKGFHGEVRLADTIEAIMQVKVTRRAFQNVIDHYCNLATMSKEDIYSHKKSSQVWQKLEKYATVKNITTDDEAQGIITSIGKAMKLTGNLIKSYVDNKSSWRVFKYLSVVKDLGYYATHRSRIESDGVYNTLDPQLEQISTLLKLSEHPIISRLGQRRHPIVSYDEVIYIPKMFPRITKELILKEHYEGTPNQFQPLNIIVRTPKEIESQREDIVKELFTRSSDKVPVRILAAEQLNLRGNAVKKQKANNAGEGLSNDETAILIHIHGGGFMGSSSFSHKTFLGTWVNEMKFICFGIDYSLTPDNPFPSGLDDCWQAYLWIINYAEAVLRIKTSKVIITGDSAGGALTMGLTLRLIKNGLKTPHGLLLIYPLLHVDPNLSSPSRLLNYDDAILSLGLMRVVAKAYLGSGDEKEHKDLLENPFVSPILASDQLLSKLPPIRMGIATIDPLHDDCLRMLARLRSLNKDAKVTAYKDLLHGFQVMTNLENYKTLDEDFCQFIRELVSNTESAK